MAFSEAPESARNTAGDDVPRRHLPQRKGMIMKIHRSASVHWEGGLRDGKGAISTASGALAHYPYGFASRFEGVAGSNPEELLGAAHAACFTMALTLVLSEAGLTADALDTKAVVTLEQVEGGFHIPLVELTLRASIPGADDAAFQVAAAAAKANCPLSKVINAEITLDAQLV
jgi:lipoyl-dependent peroxiredoxin